MFCDGLSIGVNVCLVLVILTLGFLFSLPLNFILTEKSAAMQEIVSGRDEESFERISIDYRRLKLCENSDYRSVINSVFLTCDNDENCARFYDRSTAISGRELSSERSSPIVDDFVGTNDENDNGGKKFINGDTNRRNSNANVQRKSVSIAGNILGVVLVLSALVALVEVLRVRLFETNDKHRGARKCSSVVDSSQRRYARKDTVQAQKSFEIQGMMHRSPIRLLAARPPPLLRRSSFPAQFVTKKDSTTTTTTTTTITGRLSRSPSFLVDYEENPINFTEFRRHSRLIRRH